MSKLQSPFPTGEEGLTPFFKVMSRPFRALSLFLSVPRALPWANISRPFGAQNVYTQNVQTTLPSFTGRERLCNDFAMYVFMGESTPNRPVCQPNNSSELLPSSVTPQSHLPSIYRSRRPRSHDLPGHRVHPTPRGEYWDHDIKEKERRGGVTG
jgi:hypothetical protein